MQEAKVKLWNYLISPNESFWRYVVFVALFAFAGTLALLSIVLLTTWLLGVDVLAALPEQAVTISAIVGGIVWGPLAETLLLVVVIITLQKIHNNKFFVSIATALIFASIHAAFDFIWFFGVFFSFFVYASAYQAWRCKSFSIAFAAAAVPHAIVNTLGLLLMTMASIKA